MNTTDPPADNLDDYQMPGGDMNASGGPTDGQPADNVYAPIEDDHEYETPTVRRCATMDVHRRLISASPDYVAARNAIENQTLAFARSAYAARPGVTRIPVVVHVVWNTPAQNIADTQIASQIDVLNHDFRRANADVNNTPAPFLPLATDTRVEFFLAQVGPTGAATTGIERRQTTLTSFSDDDAVKSAATGGMDAWPASDYLNIWVGQLSGGLLGYAQFPGGPAATDGVVILQSAFGTSGTATPPFHLGRTATHEIGHWLNLNHIWGDDGVGCAGTDNVADTPNQGGPNTGTPAFPHVSCSNEPNGDMFMNYMDYVDDPAMFMFSAGQVTRMQACLDGPRANIGTVLPQQAWHLSDLTAVTQAPAAASDPTGYMFDAQGTQHVAYRGTNGHIYELWSDADGWHLSDLTVVTQAPAAAGDPTGYMFDAQGTQHVAYRGTNGHIYELWWG